MINVEWDLQNMESISRFNQEIAGSSFEWGTRLGGAKTGIDATIQGNSKPG